MTEELEPCPFCGVYPQVKEWEVGGIKQIKIICDGDFCHVHPSVFGNKETMMKMWNTRSHPKYKRVDLDKEKIADPVTKDHLSYSKIYNEAIDDIKAKYGDLYTEVKNG